METKTTPKFQAHLQRGGTGLLEMRRLLEAFAEHGNLERLKQQAFKENLLGKTSERLVKDMLYAFKRRFLEPLDLPPVRLIAQAMCSPIPDVAKNQVLFPYFVHTDPLVEECYRDLVLARLGSSQAQLATGEVIDYLSTLSESHPELARWSEHLRVRWSQGFLALLRHFGLMERHPRTTLRRLWLLPESFAFFWLWFWQQDQSFWDADRSEVWLILQLDERGKNELLTDGQLRGWWHYQRLGEIVQFKPRFSSVEEWIKDGLA